MKLVLQNGTAILRIAMSFSNAKPLKKSKVYYEMRDMIKMLNLSETGNFLSYFFHIKFGFSLQVPRSTCRCHISEVLH